MLARSPMSVGPGTRYNSNSNNSTYVVCPPSPIRRNVSFNGITTVKVIGNDALAVGRLKLLNQNEAHIGDSSGTSTSSSSSGSGGTGLGSLGGLGGNSNTSSQLLTLLEEEVESDERRSPLSDPGPDPNPNPNPDTVLSKSQSQSESQSVLGNECILESDVNVNASSTNTNASISTGSSSNKGRVSPIPISIRGAIQVLGSDSDSGTGTDTSTGGAIGQVSDGEGEGVDEDEDSPFLPQIGDGVDGDGLDITSFNTSSSSSSGSGTNTDGSIEKIIKITTPTTTPTTTPPLPLPIPPSLPTSTSSDALIEKTVPSPPTSTSSATTPIPTTTGVTDHSKPTSADSESIAAAAQDLITTMSSKRYCNGADAYVTQLESISPLGVLAKTLKSLTSRNTVVYSVMLYTINMCIITAVSICTPLWLLQHSDSSSNNIDIDTDSSNTTGSVAHSSDVVLDTSTVHMDGMGMGLDPSSVGGMGNMETRTHSHHSPTGSPTAMVASTWDPINNPR